MADDTAHLPEAASDSSPKTRAIVPTSMHRGPTLYRWSGAAAGAAAEHAQLLYQLADLDGRTAGAIALVLRPVLSVSTLLMITRIVLSWYPQVAPASHSQPCIVNCTSAGCLLPAALLLLMSLQGQGPSCHAATQADGRLNRVPQCSL